MYMRAAPGAGKAGASHSRAVALMGAAGVHDHANVKQHSVGEALPVADMPSKFVPRTSKRGPPSIVMACGDTNDSAGCGSRAIGKPAFELLHRRLFEAATYMVCTEADTFGGQKHRIAVSLRYQAGERTRPVSPMAGIH